MSSNPYNQHQNALQAIFGPTAATPWAPSATLASASGEGAISYTGPLNLYGFSYQVSAANNTADLRLIDASATGVLTPVVYNIKYIPAGHGAITFPRPIKFDKGLVFQACATGTALPQLYLHWGA